MRIHAWLLAIALALASASCGGTAKRGPAPLDAARDSVRLRAIADSIQTRGRASLAARRFVTRLGAPRADRGTDHLFWTPETLEVAPRLRAWAIALGPSATPSDQDSARAWRALVADPALRPFALLRFAASALAARDTITADSLWGVLASEDGIWTWEALRARSNLGLARGDTARADSLLRDADRESWPDVERAAWLIRRTVLLTTLGDTAEAATFARQALRRYPAISVTVQATSALERIAAARGDSLDPEDQRLAAEVDYYRLDRASAMRRLARAFAEWRGADRWRVALRLGEVARLAKRFPDALAALDSARRVAPDAEARARCALERGRVLRDSGDPEASFRAYALAATLATDPDTRESAVWERAREEEEQQRWKPARTHYAQVISFGQRRADEAALRLGVLWYREGRRERALASWTLGDSEALRFWRAIARRAARPDSTSAALESIAALPGYGFYRASARESLGIHAAAALPDSVAPATIDSTTPAALRLAADLVSAGLIDGALSLLQRFTAGDRRLAGPVPPRRDALLIASRLAYQCGAIPTGIRLAERALGIAGPDVAVARRIVPWLYPPGIESITDSPADSFAKEVEPALLEAVAWKESKFDTTARSRSGARGVVQLMPATAATLARRLGLAVPGDSSLGDPRLGLRLGAAELALQIARFNGSVPLALAAYNAGPDAAARWGDAAKGVGDALTCELIAYPETQDYVKVIVGLRQAYRDFRPRLGPE